MEDGPILPGRECGACDVCCVALTIDDERLRKPQGIPCHNLLPGKGGCAVYAVRPQTCRRFQCGWRQLRWVNEALRPDISGVLIRLHSCPESAGSAGMAMMLQLRDAAAVKQPGLAEALATAVSNGIGVYLEVPGRPGFTAASARVDAGLMPFVKARDKAGLLAALAEWRQQGEGGERAPVVV